MVERMMGPEAEQRRDAEALQREALKLPELDEKIDNTLSEMPTKAGRGLTQEDASEIVEHEINAVYQTIRDHIEALPDALSAEEVMDKDKFREVVEEYFGKIETVISAPGERMQTIDRDVKNVGEISNLLGLYRQKYESHFN